jgi:hypothetical protein
MVDGARGHRSRPWAALLATGGVKCVPIPARSPNCDPHAERFVKTVRTESLDHFVILGERHVRHLIKEGRSPSFIFLGLFCSKMYNWRG